MGLARHGALAPSRGIDRLAASLPNYFDRRGTIKAFDSVAIYQEASVIVGDRGTPRRVPILRISPEFFRTLGVPLAMGQSFTEETFAYRADEVAILTDEFWRSHFNADPQVLGRTFENDGARIAVVGVPDPDKGEALVLLSTTASEAVKQELIQLRYTLLEHGVPALWIPKRLVRVETIPVLASGKLDIRSCERLALEHAE